MRNAIIVSVLFAFTFCFSNSSCSSKKDSEGTPADTLQTVLLQIKKCSRLYTAECRIHKIVTFSDDMKLRGRVVGQSVNIPIPVGDRKIAIPMDATVKAYIDLSLITEDDITISSDGHLTITLPQPVTTLTNTKIDQKGIREYVAIARAHFGDSEMAALEQQGRQAIIETIPRLGLEEQAREGVAQLLSPLLSELGFDAGSTTFVFEQKNICRQLR